MALVVKDRVQEITTTTGTGTVTLGGAVLGYQSFSTVGNGNTTYYTIVDLITGDWEVGIGTYTSSGTTLSRTTVLSSSNAGSLVSFSVGTKNVFVTYPSSRSVYLSAAGLAVDVLDIGTLGTSTANISTANITAGTVSTTPVNNTDIVNKQYADAIASGIHFHEAVDLATTTALPANTYSNGASGVGATLTATANGALSVDSTLTVASNRILVKNEAAGANNGVYTVTQVGSAGAPYILTRATDFDTAGTGVDQIDEGDFFLVTSGATNLNTAWVQQTAPPIVIGTTAIVFQQFAAPITYTAGTGLNESPSYTFNIATTGVSAATYGSASQVPVFAVNAQGQITSVTNTAIAIAAGAVSGLAASATTDTTNAANISSGTLPTGRLSGSYTGITGVGTLAAGTWNGSVIGPVYGGTGFGTYAVGDLLYADTTSSLAKLADVAVGNALISGGVGSAPSWGKIGLATHTSGTLPIANGGTNTSATATNGGVTYGTGTAYAFTAAGTSGQVLQSNGAAAPTWVNLSTLGVSSFSAGTTGFTPSSATSGAVTLAGTLATTNGGTGLTSFTNGGIVYASSTSALATGSALTWNGTTFGVTGAIGLGQSTTFPTVGFTSNPNGYLYLLGGTNGVLTQVGAVNITTVSSTGLAVTGTLSTTGNITNSNAAGRLDFTGGSSAQVWATASSLYLDASAGQSVIIRPNNQVTAGTFSSTGLAVTGTLTASTDMRAPIFYDSNNTSYYLDPATGAFLASTTTSFVIDGGSNSSAGPTIQSSSAAGPKVGIKNTSTGGKDIWLISNGSSNADGAGKLQLWNNTDSYTAATFATTSSMVHMLYGSYTQMAGSSRAPIFYDSDNTAYYLDPNSTQSLRTVGDWRSDSSTWTGEFSGKMQYHSNYWYIQALNGWFFRNSGGANVLECNASGDLTVSSSSRAPIFYDSNNTSYYLDPASSSSINQLTLAGALYRSATAAGYLNGNYNTVETISTSGAIYSIGGAYVPGTTTLGNMYGIGYTYAGYAAGNPGGVPTGTWGMYVASGGTARIFLDSDNGRGYFASQVNATIFYDANDTTYFIDPNATGSARFAGYMGLGGNAYNSNMSGTFGVSIRHAANPAVGFSSSTGPDYLIYKNGSNLDVWNSTNSTVLSFYPGPYTQMVGSARAPLFYDSDNTGYYVDPASTSEINKVYYNSNMTSRNYGIGQVGIYDSTRYQAVFAMGEAYILPANGTTTGNLYGMAWSHPNAGGIAGNLTDHGLLIVNAGGFRCAISNSIVAAANITAYSDERLKKNWRDMPEGYVTRLAQVKVGVYDRIDEEGVTQVGVSAQSLQKLLPQAIMTARDEIGTLSVNYGGAALASAVELAKYTVALEQRIAQLEKKLEELVAK